MILPALVLHLALAQEPPPPDPCAGATRCITFTFDRPGAPVSHFVMEVNGEGWGRYTPQANEEGASVARRITVSPPTARQMFAAAPVVAGGRCETRMKHIAKSGQKTIAVAVDHQAATCTFNFSDAEVLNSASALFQAVASTLALADRLEHAHRFDRLGLDAEIDILTSENKAGRAIELQNAAATLQSIMNDERLMDRVRRKAARMLQEPDPPAAQ